ncbi:zinc finger CCCH-type antiviral protein 1-like [Dryobates pubescens]|uniref:zinc finger CCCH-type antiviral protein 1-like n=1 Tax=Dryobates pubescens TaxID=118200 RepID=UPI0023B89D72|nr:zinc finger CCCH-type antiviral protein 1-like [Dryobates pubescens]
MSDPAVCSFLTKTLCAHGGQLGLSELQQHVGLSARQLEETLSAAGPQSFLVQRGDGDGSARVLAVSAVRLCPRQECGGCERLHLCKLHLMGKCNLGPRACKYSHDIFSAENKKVLKTHGLSGLDENELRVLLLQNDPFILPDTCQFYNRKEGTCNQQNNCKRLHVCRHFLHGECRFLKCKRSHNLLNVHALRLLEAIGIDSNTVSNIQIVYDHKHVEFNKELQKERVPTYKPSANVMKNTVTTISKDVRLPSQTVRSRAHVPPSGGNYLGPSSNVLGQSQQQVPTEARGKHAALPEVNTGAGAKDEGTGAGAKDEGTGAGAKDKGTGAGAKYNGTRAGAKDEGTGAGAKDEGTGAGAKDEGTGAGAKDKGTGAGAKYNGTRAGAKDEGTGAGAKDEGTGAGAKYNGTGAGAKDEDKKDASSAKDSKNTKEEKCDEICVFYVWKYCKNNDKCTSVHYHLPYRWQVYNGITWTDLSMMEDVERAYCDPKISSMADRNINFQTMTLSHCSLRRLSTPSSVTRPSFLLTTEWIWYWKNDLGQWIEYGEQGEGDIVKSPTSAIIENLYLADPDATVSFQVGLHRYQLNFKEMTQKNITYKTERRVCRRPKFVSSEDVQKIKRGQRDSSISNQTCPSHWDPSALPEFGYKAVEISNTSSEYHTIKQLFLQTMKNYIILTMQRIQNPALWKVFQWKKEQMKRENGGKDVSEKLLFHGCNNTYMKSICHYNFDWRLCGSNGTNYGMGSYFARDASYSHEYCQPLGKVRIMFVARVLVGDYTRGSAAYVRPPPKRVGSLQFYDSCVDNEFNPSVFVVFEKQQIYPEYIITYKADEERCSLS